MKNTMRWFINNSVAANILMITLLVTGIFSLTLTRKELIPNVQLERIAILIDYPGASPSEIEMTICQPVENSIIDLEGIEEITTIAGASHCNIQVEVRHHFDTRILSDNIKTRLDSMNNLPEGAQRPIVNESRVRSRVASIIISGDVSAEILTHSATQIKNTLLQNPFISSVDMNHARDFELSIQLHSDKMHRYNLNYDQIADTIRQSSTNLPGGTLQTPSGDILIQTAGKALTKNDFANIVINTSRQGGRLLLKDVATIVDGLDSDHTRAYFNQDNALVIDVFRVGNQNIIDIARIIRRYVQKPPLLLPHGVNLTLWHDDAKHFESRIKLLSENAVIGLGLLFITLYFFLNIKLAFWVSVGIPVAFLGAFPVLPLTDSSINAISLFSFILVLGIVVDDAIIVGESIYTNVKPNCENRHAALMGVCAVHKPIVFSILTTIVAFFPLMILPGPEGQLMQIIPVIVISVLILSLIESLFILPSHLSHLEYNDVTLEHSGNKTQRWLTQKMDQWITRYYRPTLDIALKNPLPTLSLFVGTLIIATCLVIGGWLKIVLFSEIEAEFATASVVFPEGSTILQTEQAIKKLSLAAVTLQNKLSDQDGISPIQDILTVIAPREKTGLHLSDGQSNRGTVSLALSDSRSRAISGKDIVDQWRQLTGPIYGASHLRFESNLNNPNPDIALDFFCDDLVHLKAATDYVREQLTQFPGIYEVRSDNQSGRKTVAIRLKPTAQDQSVTLKFIGRQVHQAVQGIELQRFGRGSSEVHVVLSADENIRSSMALLHDWPITLPDGTSLPLGHLAYIDEPEYSPSVRRINRQRSIQVSGFIDGNVSSSEQIYQALDTFLQDEFRQRYPDIQWSITGKQKAINNFLSVLSSSYSLALIIIYFLLAILFSSYTQPFLLMVAIPFGVIGSLAGHGLLGIDVTLWSLVGMVAVSGVVVNDNLVLVDSINAQRRQGHDMLTAVRNAGAIRFRPIVLTSATTFIGLLPLIMESSLQAQFLIPMAVSLAFGVLFATIITLLLMPVLYLMSEKIKAIFTPILADESESGDNHGKLQGT